MKFIGISALLVAMAHAAQAQPAVNSGALSDPSKACREAARVAEREAGIPPHLLSAIARVESGRRDHGTGRVTPWPWTINAEGEGRFFQSRAEAVAAVRQLQARGVRSIDVGCMQVNLSHHPTAFTTLEDAFDPLVNARYAARFLRELNESRRDWHQAVGAYHSQTSHLAGTYRERVSAAWPEEIMEAAQVMTASARPSFNPSSLPPLPSGQALPGQAAQAPGSQPGQTLGGGGLDNGAERAQILPAQGGSRGRGLDAYRGAPISITSRGFQASPTSVQRGRS